MDQPTPDQDFKSINQPITQYDATKIKPIAQLTLEDKKKVMSDESYQQIQDQILSTEEYIFNKELYWGSYNFIINFKKKLVNSLDKVLQAIQEQLKIIDSIESKLFCQSMQQKIIQQIFLENLQQECLNQYELNKEFMNHAKQLMNLLQKKHQIKEQLITQIDQNPKNIFEEQFLGWQKIECELIQQSSRKEKTCRSFTFNNKNNILLVACEETIMIYQFQNGLFIKELQRLNDHAHTVSSLYFMKLSNSFVSGSYKQSLIIWEFDNNKNKWFAKQILKGHKNWVHRILMNTNEDLLISGSDDKLILWEKVNNYWSSKQTISVDNVLYDISLNEQEDKLISCGSQAFISVMEKGSNNQWKIVQSIDTASGGYRLSFTNENQFVFQPDKGDQLEIYDYDQGKTQFYLLKTVKIHLQQDDWLYFPCQYLKNIKLLMVKYGRQVNLFKINQKNDYQLIQQIEFQSNWLFGILTDDGQYLVTYDYGSYEIQVRKLNLY